MKDKIIIVGDIGFSNRRAEIYSIDEVYHAGSKEEQEVIEDMLDSMGADWIVIQDYKGQINIHKDCLLSLLGQQNTQIANSAINKKA